MSHSAQSQFKQCYLKYVRNELTYESYCEKRAALIKAAIDGRVRVEASGTIPMGALPTTLPPFKLKRPKRLWLLFGLAIVLLLLATFIAVEFV
ncbi:hypothetical protein [Paraferrimonas sedimenticola]|uniref:hypothetical protein n=1 Tax=Paraferrimonas sedimenticola TaxID=375674 RepID=UPI000BA8FCB4|nr:hypothetical protein [Paraferrimonas sedimenticola]